MMYYGQGENGVGTRGGFTISMLHITNASGSIIN